MLYHFGHGLDGVVDLILGGLGPQGQAQGAVGHLVGAETTQEEIDYTIQSVAEVVERLRAMSPVWDELQKGVRSYVIQ